jgi:hypothetical protein
MVVPCRTRLQDLPPSILQAINGKLPREDKVQYLAWKPGYHGF